MIFLSPILKRDFDTFFTQVFESEDHCWLICDCGSLRELFDIPEHAKQIQFCFYKEPKGSRVKIVFAQQNKWNVMAGEEEYYLTTNTAKQVRKLLGRWNTWYIDLYYWE